MTLARQLGSCFPRFKPCIISLDGLWPQSGHGAPRRRPNRYETSGKSVRLEQVALTPSVRHQSVRAVCLFVRALLDLGPAPNQFAARIPFLLLLPLAHRMTYECTSAVRSGVRGQSIDSSTWRDNLIRIQRDGDGDLWQCQCCTCIVGRQQWIRWQGIQIMHCGLMQLLYQSTYKVENLLKE